MSVPSRQNASLWVVVPAALAAFMSRLDSSIVNISLPSIAEQFQVGASAVSLVVLVYLLALAGTLMLFGRIIDRLGLRRVLLAGYGLFSVTSLLCGISPSLELLVAARFFQGFGGSMLYVASFVVVSRCLPENRRGWGFGILGTFSAIGVTLGAPLGGLLTGYLSWHWIFLLNLPVGVAALVLVHGTMPSEHPVDPAAVGSFDLVGALLSFPTIALATGALILGQHHGFASLSVLACAAGAAVCLVAFVLWERHHPEPLLDLSLFADWRFTLSINAHVLVLTIVSGTMFLIPFYLEGPLGFSPESSGLVFMVFSGVVIVAGPLAGTLSDRINPRLLCLTALVSLFGACLVFSRTLGAGELALLIVFLAWAAASCASFITPSNNIVMGLAPEGEQGMAAGVFNTINNFGFIVGVALFAGLLAPGAGSESAAKDVLALPPETLLAGFETSFLIAAGIAMLATVLVLAALVADRRGRSSAS